MEIFGYAIAGNFEVSKSLFRYKTRTFLSLVIEAKLNAFSQMI